MRTFEIGTCGDIQVSLLLSDWQYRLIQKTNDHICDIAHVGWECDDKGWVVKTEDDKILLITTDHSLVVQSGEEATKKLHELKAKYQDLIDSTNIAEEFFKS